MNEQDLELLITRHLDGDLSAGEEGILQARLAGDPQAQRLLDEHRKLGAILASEPNLPAIDWNRLADNISATIDQTAEEPAVIYSFKRARLAIAASVLICLGAGIWIIARSTGPSPAGRIEVAIAQANEQPVGEARATIEIITPAETASLPVREAILANSSRVAIDSAVVPMQDSDRLPY